MAPCLSPQALVVGFEHRISTRRGADDRQVQQVAQLASTALDETASLMLAAAVLVGHHADQGTGLLVGDKTELGQEGDQAGGTDLAQVGHAADEARPLGELRVGPTLASIAASRTDTCSLMFFSILR